MLAILSGRCGLAADEFQDLVGQIPRSANAVVLLNMEKAKASPLGLQEHWKENVEKAFEDGLVRVPPQATRFVMASQIDFESEEPYWEAAVIDLDQGLAMAQVVKARGGAEEKIEGLPAALLQNGTYVLQLGPKRLAAMRPGNRQTVVRWMRDVRKRSPPPLSPYLQKAAVYSDEAGSEIIMAIDLEGAMSWERVCDYLAKHKKSLREWQGKGESSISLTVAARVVSSVRGIRIGVRIGEQPTARIVVDLSDEAYLLAGIAKPLLLQILSDNGALINDFQSWTVQAAGSEILLSGRLSSKGLRELLSVVDSPVGDDFSAAKETDASPGQPQATQAEKSRRYFRTIMDMADDLKDDMKNAANLASTQLFFERYAKRIERMPILGIDEDLLKYSAYVANALGQSSMAIKTMGIQSGVRQASIIPSWDYYYNDGTSVGDERRVVRAREGHRSHQHPAGSSGNHRSHQRHAPQDDPEIPSGVLSGNNQWAALMGCGEGNGVMIQASFRIVAPEDKRQEILDVLLCLKGPTEVAKGCGACRILQDVEDDHAITYLVRWDTQEEIEEHLRSERFRRLLPYIEMSLEPPEVDFSTIDKLQGIEFLIDALKFVALTKPIVRRKPHDLASALSGSPLFCELDLDTARAEHRAGPRNSSVASPSRSVVGLGVRHQSRNRADGAGNDVLVDVHFHRVRMLRLADCGTARQRQLTPRIIALVFRDPVTKLSLTIFVFTFTFSQAVLVRINTEVPTLSARLAAYSCIACLGVFLFLIDHVGKWLRPSGALRTVAAMGRGVVENVYPRRLAEAQESPREPSAIFSGEPTLTVTNLKNGVVLAVDIDGLAAMAQRADCVIEMAPQVGDFVAIGDPLFRVFQGGPGVTADALRQSVAVGQERTLEQDPALPLRIMVDIAAKGLSPAINDPTTAVLAIDQIHDFLRNVGSRRLDDDRVRDAAGRVRLVCRTPAWEDFVKLAVTEIRHFGGASIQVSRRLHAMLENLIQTLPDERVPLLRQELSLLHRSAERFFPEPEDRALADVSDFQGMGSKCGQHQEANH